MDYQQTLASTAVICGVGVHTGVKVSLRLAPASANTGIVFKRTDLEGFSIEGRVRNVERVSYATTLMRKGVLISTTEHLLSALAALEVDNAIVEIDNLELPIMDGSALPFVRLIQEAGLKRLRARRKYLKILKPVEVMDAGKRMAVYPADRFFVTYRIVFSHPLIGEQIREYVPGEASYEREIAPARTFGFIEELEGLRKIGLIRGGSLANAVVLTRDRVVNPEGLRFPDEFCRHKMLDLIGDLSLLGHPIIGHVLADRAGHAMHAALARQILADKTAWKLVDATEEKRESAISSQESEDRKRKPSVVRGPLPVVKDEGAYLATAGRRSQESGAGSQ